MFQEKRPTCLTVIGWAWIIIGGLMCFSATMAIIISIVGHQISETQAQGRQNIPIGVELLTALAVVQLAVGASGAVSGANLLKLKSWSRGVLESLTWLLVAVIIGCTLFWASKWLSAVSGHEDPGTAFNGAFVCLAIAMIYGIPLCVMLRYLRGTKVRSALRGPGDPND